MGFSYSHSLPVARTGTERATLVRRTYALVFGGVLVTMIGAQFGLSQPALMQAVAAHPFLTFFATMVPLFLAQWARDRFPANVGLVLAFTFAEGVWISPLLFVYGQRAPGAIQSAALLTLTTFAVLTAYAFVSRRDFSAWGSFFTVGLWVLIATSLLNLFFKSALADTWIAGATVLVFSGLLIFDTWRLRNQYGPNDYVLAAVNIYLDLLNLFLALLRLLGGRRD